ncbi:MAG: S8 family peptidase [Anaeromicrobium sp.]|jgi:hypothetical protein|uniref:S8 family peptidase n=1 Tax=Anaeromicrobium sp. TaxID=1929132 RepID=UPI0025EB4F93|nr:S8 family peptidase [Anaeromicrobium sp.]MCT4593204.1 S8 family peptidase [Anaeromicrobium sp.]
MKEKHLPIKIFEKRLEVDERQTEGGGSDKPPKWVLKGEALIHKAKILKEELSEAKTQVEQKMEKYNNVPAILKAKIVEDALAKSHRKEISQLFYSNQKKDRIIGLSRDQELIIRIDDVAELEAINKKLLQTQKNAKAISGVESIESFEPMIDTSKTEITKNGKFIFKVRLHDYSDYHTNKQVLRTFERLLERNKYLKLDKTVKYSEKLYIHQITADSLDALNDIDDFSGILSIEPMPLLKVITDDFFLENVVQVPAPNKDVEYPVVGVLDSGISDIPQLRPWIIGKRHTNYPTQVIDPSHGTFVSGIIGFGDLLEGKSYTDVNGCKLFDAAVFPNPRKEEISEAYLVDNVREAIDKHSDTIKIWNMSLGSEYEVNNGDFTEFGIALDSIQDENEVLIIKSAGNCRNFLNNKCVSRIARGADSVRALTIGSIAHSKISTDLADINHLSPFSRVGPGPANIIKPDLVHYGGNCGVNSGRPIPNGVCSFDINGNLRNTIGTSFSTPRVSAIAADLNDKLKEGFDPVLIKALLIHSAKYPQEVDLDISEKLNQLGFGLPSSSSGILYNDPSEITLVLRENLVKGEYIDILDFPFPESLVDDDGYYYGQIILTVVNTPILAENEGTEYCQSNIDVKLGTYNNKCQRDTTKKTIKNPIGRDEGSYNLLNTSCYSKKKSNIKHKNFATAEKMLVQYGDKFYPNKKYAVDLSELTQTNKEKYIQAPKKWFLKVTGLYREFAERKAEIERKELSQECCIIVTIRDPYKAEPIYREVTKLLERNNFLHRDIKLKQNIHINLRGNQEV